MGIIVLIHMVECFRTVMLKSISQLPRSNSEREMCCASNMIESRVFLKWPMKEMAVTK